MSTNNTEVEGSIVHVVHVDESGAEPEKTALALTTDDGVGELDIDEDEESINLSSVRRTRRYRTHNEPTLEVESLIAADMDAAELLGIVDEEGALDFSNDARRFGEDEYLHIEYFNDEGATEPELIHRFGEVETVNPSIDPSETPPLMSWDMWIHGEIILHYDDS